MDNKFAYDKWSKQYDSNLNKTRDLEGTAIRQLLINHTFKNTIEIGAGSGKNTIFLSKISDYILAVDFSPEMLNIAKKRTYQNEVNFQLSDITESWKFVDREFDLIGFSLVLEHIENLDHIFQQANQALTDDGLIYIGELHPYKQYQNSNARFETADGDLINLDCYTHHMSEFIQLAKKYNFSIITIDEFFDADADTPRIIRYIFKKVN